MTDRSDPDLNADLTNRSGADPNRGTNASTNAGAGPAVNHVDSARAVDPDEHPAHVEEWRSDETVPADVDVEAVIDEETPVAVRTDRGDTVIVPDDERPVVLEDDEDALASDEATLEDHDGFDDSDGFDDR